MLLKHLVEETTQHLYHFSTQENLDKIKSDGFIPTGVDGVYGTGIYLTDDPHFRDLPFFEIKLKPHRQLEVPNDAESPNQFFKDRFGVTSWDPSFKNLVLKAGFKTFKIHRNDGSNWVIVLDDSIISII